MDFSRYDQSLQKLHAQHQEYLRVADKSVIGVLNKMLEKAQALDDQELMGYVYHSIAFAEHFVTGRYSMFLKNLALSAGCLLRCEDQSEMMHVYYLVAIDAMNKGLNDISAYYFQEARNIAETTGQETSASILNQSIGHIFMQLGQYQEARRLIKKALTGIKKDKNHPHYLSNLTACYMNDTIACLELENPKQAETSFKKASTILKKHPNEFRGGTHINYQLLRLRIALSGEYRKEAEESFDTLTSLMREDTMLHLYMDEIKKLVELLMEKKEYPWIEEIIDIIDEAGIASDAVDGLKTFAKIKIDYYKAVGNGKKLKDSYEEHDRVCELTVSQQKSSRIYITSLVEFTTNLRREREEIIAEKDALLNMAKVDALTKISNRYGANIKLDEAFETAYINEKNLGIVYIDVDGLKEINNTKGHLEGDEYLATLAEALGEEASKAGCFVSRFGGDEFVLIFEDKEDEEIEEFISRVKERSGVKFSSGIYNAVPYGKQKSWDFLELADMELYKEKKYKTRRLKGEKE